MQRNSSSATHKYHSIFDALPRMVMEEGPRALFYGLVPGFHRQIIFIGVGNGIYVPLRDALFVGQSSASGSNEFGKQPKASVF